MIFFLKCLIFSRYFLNIIFNKFKDKNGVIILCILGMLFSFLCSLFFYYEVSFAQEEDIIPKDNDDKDFFLALLNVINYIDSVYLNNIINYYIVTSIKGVWFGVKYVSYKFYQLNMFLNTFNWVFLLLILFFMPK